MNPFQTAAAALFGGMARPQLSALSARRWLRGDACELRIVLKGHAHRLERNSAAACGNCITLLPVFRAKI